MSDDKRARPAVARTDPSESHEPDPDAARLAHVDVETRHAEKTRTRPKIRIGKASTENATDVGNARRLTALYGDDFRFVEAWGSWLVWDNDRWIADEGGVRMQWFAKATARAIYAEAAEEYDSDRRARLAKWATRSETKGSIEAMIALAKSEHGIAVSHTALDRDPWLLNVSNGTIDLKTGILRPHMRSDLITKIARVVYDPETACCPTWEAFVSESMGGDGELASYLQRVIGYALTGSTREHALFFFHGDGANGKSTFLRALHETFGDYAARAPRGLLFRAKGGDRHPTELAGLHGARFVTCAEIEDGQAFDEALVKDLTGGDPIEARRMREDFWTFDPTHKLFIAGNYKPLIRGADEGIWRRMRLVPWAVTIPPEKRDKQLADKLARERPGILTWAVRGCVAWQRDGLGDPRHVREATDAYREESDPLAEFCERRCEFIPDVKTPRKFVRAAYEQWCEENGAEPLGTRRFTAGLKARGVIDGGTIRVGDRNGSKIVDAWLGVQLRKTT